jgi:uncharacterized protein (DUF362 family)
MKKEAKEKQKQAIEKVAVVKCINYDQSRVDSAVAKAFKLIEAEKMFKPGMKVLLKPNVLGSYTHKKQCAITTNPALITSVCKILKKHKCKIYIGDSSFMGTSAAMVNSGIEKVAKHYATNKKAMAFEKEKLKKITDYSAKIIKKFPIPKIAKDVDLIINMPKMKTHSLARVTLGIKNLYGLIPGGLKQRLHVKAKRDKFSHILVDIYQNLVPQLNILDGVVGMEGHGPASGTPKKASLILASKNTVALDIAASTIMEFKPKEIPAIRYSIQRGLYPTYKFKLVGMKKLPSIHFRKPTKGKILSRVRQMLRREKPIVCDTKKCIECGTCASHCPVKCIKLHPYPDIDKRKCIRCFCCMEVCPVHALTLGKHGADMWQNYEEEKKK